MVNLVQNPVIINAAGDPPKQIEEFFGRASTKENGVSIARMVSPAGWSEPGQCPEFDEYTVVLKGELVIETEDTTLHVKAGQAVMAGRGEWVRYSTPECAEYISVCIPAFGNDGAHRD
ncbi:cupin [bacterium]|nr:cupin [bacterium]